MKKLIELSYKVDNFLEMIFKSLSLFSLVLVFAITLQVFLRYFLNSTSVKLEELQWHFYGVIIMMGLGYCQIKNTHVRVDILQARFSQKTKNIIELLGIVLIFMPFFVVVFLHSIDYFLLALKFNESSDAPSGLPYRWLIKFFIPLGFFLMFIANMTHMVRVINKVFCKKS